MTEKLYDKDSFLTEFDAVVTSCEKSDDIYKITLDKTAFFPEEGGQCCDKGCIDKVEITYVELKGDEIYHYCKSPFEVGTKVFGEINFDIRFRNMQNHSGEHIISGISHNLFGYNNVGFHLGYDNVTMDLDGPLTEEEVKKIENLANEAIYKNMQVLAYYPNEDELENLFYRSKSEIKEKIRIVKIGDLDTCACCAPHVKTTGEIGIIKIIGAMKYKGGTRLNILCGKDALSHYQNLHYENMKISNLLSVKQEETYKGVEKLLSDINSLNIKLSQRTKRIAKMIIDSIEYTSENICLFVEDADVNNLRLIANDIKEKTSSYGIVLSGNDNDGYKYIIISKDNEVSGFTRLANENLSGRGGGRDNMSTGTFMATKEKIEKYFKIKD